jgi:hypothetical protein
MVGAASPAAPTRPLPRLLGVLPSRQLVTQDAPHPTAELVPTPPSFTTVVLAGPATSMSLTAVVSPADRRGRHCDGEGLRCFPRLAVLQGEDRPCRARPADPVRDRRGPER